VTEVGETVSSPDLSAIPPSYPGRYERNMGKGIAALLAPFRPHILDAGTSEWI
jgi:hypothetical protein